MNATTLPGPRLDVDTGLPHADDLVAALERDAALPRALELVAALTPDGVEEPFAVSTDRREARRFGIALEEIAEHYAGTAFCVSASVYAFLLPADAPAGAASSFAQRALAGASPRFGACVVHSRVSVPDEAPADREALKLALDQARGRAALHPSAPGRQVRDVLLALLQERRDEATPVRRPQVAGHAVTLGRRLGLTALQLDELVRAAELQDVGMLALQATLGKQAPLSDEDWAAIRKHPIAGERVLAAAPALAGVATIVRSCYERWDGSGYPDGLSGEEIPLSARIIAVCVAYAAMTSQRLYRQALSSEAALREIGDCAGAQFDPGIVVMFEELVGREQAGPGGPHGA
jgi:HD-GYP domain-containing protein (c-di-GMP phosphodiesterase class II)